MIKSENDSRLMGTKSEHETDIKRHSHKGEMSDISVVI